VQIEVTARVVLALILAAASLGKLASQDDPGRLAQAFELDRRMVPLVTVLPAVELAVAAGLLLPATSRWAALVACGLLATFTVVLLRARRRGLTGSCNCFGSLSAAHHKAKGNSAWPLVRNSALFAASMGVALDQAQAPVSAIWHQGWPRDAVSMAAAAAVMLAAPVAYILQQRSHWTRPRAAGALDREVATLDGARFAVRELVSDRISTFVFIDPACGPCRSVLPTLRSALESRQPLFVVSSGGERGTRELFPSTHHDRVILDDGSLALACAIQGTPGGVVVSTEGISEPVAGVGAVVALLGGEVQPEPDAAFGKSWTRRETLTAALTSAGVAMVAPTFGLPRGLTGALTSWAAVESGTTTNCPTCGSCTLCEVSLGPTSAPGISCRPCRVPCSAAKLCKQYANKTATYGQLNAYLVKAGYSQEGEPTAVGISEGGTLQALTLITVMKAKSSRSPQALLLYTLNNNGNDSAGLLLNSEGLVTSTVTASGGKTVVTAVPPPPPLGAAAPASQVKAADLAIESAGPTSCAPHCSCTDICGEALSLMQFAFNVASATTPIGLAATLASYALPRMFGAVGAGVAGLIDYSQYMSGASSMANLVFRAVKGGYKLEHPTGLVDKAEGFLCSTICKIRLKACCNYSGACFDSDALCESHCPGGLKHPMAHCDVYINGHKVSTIVPPL
jgi:hypothetical protein